MGKYVVSPIAKWSGGVTLADPMTFDQALAFRDAMDASKEFETDGLRRRKTRMPGVFKCVEEWHLVNMPSPVTLENFPVSPLVEAANLMDWLVDEISNILTGEEEVPKG